LQCTVDDGSAARKVAQNVQQPKCCVKKKKKKNYSHNFMLDALDAFKQVMINKKV
jgi:hypothetical protein